MGDAGVNARIIEAAVSDRLLTAAEATKLAAFVAKRNGDLEALLGALIRFHGVAPERAQALVAAAFAAPRANPAPPRPAGAPPRTTARLVAPPPADAPAPPRPVQAPPPAPVELDPVELPPEGAAPVEELEEVVPEPDDAPVAPAPVPAPAPEPEPASELDPSDIVLFLFPQTAGERPPAQVSVLASVLELTPYEARLRANEPLPRLVRVGPEAEVIAAAERLVGAGVGVLCAEAAAVLGPLEAFEVKRVRLESGLVFVDRDGREARIRVDRRGLVVLGRYDTTTRSTSKITSFAIRPSLGGAKLTKIEKDHSAEAVESALFAHLYFEDSDVPFVLVESAIADWEFLGPEKAPTARANLRALVEMLTSGAIGLEERLEKDHARVKESASIVQKQGKRSVSQRSTQDAADVLSRVFYHDWKNKLASSS